MSGTNPRAMGDLFVAVAVARLEYKQLRDEISLFRYTDVLTELEGAVRQERLDMARELDSLRGQ